MVTDRETQLKNKTGKDIKEEAKDRGISLVRTADELRDLLQHADPDTDYSEIKSTALREAAKQFSISTPRPKDELIRMIIESESSNGSANPEISDIHDRDPDDDDIPPKEENLSWKGMDDVDRENEEDEDDEDEKSEESVPLTSFIEEDEAKKIADASKKKGGLNAIINSVNDKYAGKDPVTGEKFIVVGKASESKALQRVPRFTSGIFALDRCLGGGIPVGRIIGVYGNKSTGKSALCTKIVSSAQRHCRYCKRIILPDYESGEPRCVCGQVAPMMTVWMDVEGVWDNQWATANGVDIDSVFVIRPEYAEQGIDVADAMIRTGEVDVLVIDSLAALTPSKEIESSVEEWQMGLSARLINKALRLWNSSLNSSGVGSMMKTTVLLINQIRSTMSPFGQKETRPGGRGQEFASSVDIRMLSGKYSFDDDNNSICLQTKFKILKNKTYPPNEEGAYKFWLRNFEDRLIGDTEEEESVFGAALKIGLIRKETGGSDKGYNFGEANAPTQKAFRDMLRTDPVLLNSIRMRTLEIITGNKLS